MGYLLDWVIRDYSTNRESEFDPPTVCKKTIPSSTWTVKKVLISYTEEINCWYQKRVRKNTLLSASLSFCFCLTFSLASNPHRIVRYTLIWELSKGKTFKPDRKTTKEKRSTSINHCHSLRIEFTAVVMRL